MSHDTVDHIVNRIAEHAAKHSLSRIRVILHGGEPLLAGADRLEYLATRLRAALTGSASVSILLQTNGMHFTDANLALLDRLRICVGVSLDGAGQDHDRHRRRRDGRGTYAEVTAGLNRLARGQYRSLFRGLLCVVDLDADPIGTYDALREFNPPAIDFILPHGNWSRPPRGIVPGEPGTLYADWLLAIFDKWYAAPVQEVSIRLFEEIIHALFTGRANVEGLGLQPSRILVIETDGSIGHSDILRSAYSGAAASRLNVRSDPFDAALSLPAIAVRQTGETGLCGQCQTCRIRHVCGAGHYAHRYRAGSGFLNPSVYCADLTELIGVIRDRVAFDVARIRARC